jgi:hypothetical protein
MDLRVKRGFIGTALARQQFFQFCGAIAPGFIGRENAWQAFFRFFNPGVTWDHRFYPPERARIRMRMDNSVFTVLPKLSRCAHVLAQTFGVTRRLKAVPTRIARFNRARNLLTYFVLRTALNVPCFDGRSPTDGENSASPEIKSAVSNFPLQINVPASRPTLPSRNSTGPEKVTAFPSPLVQVASEGFAAPQTLDFASAAIKVPFPLVCASKRIVRCSAFAKVISTFHVPVTLGVCA